MLNIQDIAISYAAQAAPIIEHFSLQVEPGEICSIVGESGSGKTSVIRAVLGCLPGGGQVTSGDILFENQSLLANNPEQWRLLRGSKISMIFQDAGAMLNPIRKIGSQFVEYIRTHQAMPKKQAYALGIEMLERMQLPDGANIMRSYPFQMSGGQRQRVGIAMGMVFQPKLLLADEPTSALDVTTQAQIVRQMMQLRDQYGTAIVIVTHNIGLAAYMADKIVVMKKGCIVEQGSSKHVLQNAQSEYTKALLAAVPSLEGERYV